MSAAHSPKVAGIDPVIPAPAHNDPSISPGPGPLDRITAVQDRLAGWVSDLTTLHELTERLARTHTLDAALKELLRAGASLAGARRGLVLLEPADGEGPVRTVGLGLDRAELGAIETIPRAAAPHGRILDGLPANPLQPDRPPADHLPAERL
ncbi:MAG TPA: phosphatase, partial [Streptomyces sp.]|nr:phosphatase [Streptomyces sp.]